jgi:hypothetical protein
MAVVRDGSWLIQGRDEKELFDVRSDPLQRHDLAGGSAAELAALQRLLEERRRARPTTAPRPEDAELEANLRALGYGE